MEKPEGWEEMYHWYKKFKPGEIHVLTNIQACTEHYSLSQTEVVSHTLKIQFMKQINQLATILYRRLSLSNLIYIYMKMSIQLIFKLYSQQMQYDTKKAT